MKIHLHSEQFDGWLHASCYKLDAPVGDPRIVGYEDFEKAPKEKRCRYCAREWWPKGGEPD